MMTVKEFLEQTARQSYEPPRPDPMTYQEFMRGGYHLRPVPQRRICQMCGDPVPLEAMYSVCLECEPWLTMGGLL